MPQAERVARVAGIFVGGASRRMGQPKALLPVAGGPSLLERTVAVVRAAGLTPVLVGRRPELPALEELIGRLGVRVIEDAAAEVGPLGGLVALLEDALSRGGAPVLALSCDLPNVQPGNLRSLMDAPAGPAVLAPRREGHWEPLAARYDPALVLPLARNRLAGGQLGLQGLLDAVRSAESPPRHDNGHLRWLDDWDTPDDVRRHESPPFTSRTPA